MSPERESDDRRATRRLPILNDEEAELVVGRKRFPVRVEDQSAGGFGVRAEAIAPLEPGQVVHLETRDERLEVLVAHVAIVEKGQRALLGGDINLEIKVGLERVRELPAVRRTFVRRNLSALRALAPHLTGARLSTLVSGLVLVLVAGATPLLAMVLIRYADIQFPKFRGAAHASRPAQGWPEAKPSKPSKPSGAAENKTPPLSPQASRPKPAARATAALPALGDRDLRALLEPEAIRQLDLTAQQQAQIQTIVDVTDAASGPPGAASPAVARPPLSDEIRARLGRILTRRQQDQLRTLQEASAPVDVP